VLKEKLERLWQRVEEEKEITMVVTRQEVEKAKTTEIEEVCIRLRESQAIN